MKSTRFDALVRETTADLFNYVRERDCAYDLFDGDAIAEIIQTYSDLSIGKISNYLDWLEDRDDEDSKIISDELKEIRDYDNTFQTYEYYTLYLDNEWGLSDVGHIHTGYVDPNSDTIQFQVERWSRGRLTPAKNKDGYYFTAKIEEVKSAYREGSTQRITFKIGKNKYRTDSFRRMK